MTSLRHFLPICGILTAITLLATGCSPPANKPATPPTPGPLEKPATEEGKSPKPEDKPDGKSGADSKASLQAVDLAGFQRILGNQKGKVVLVDFWATWCEPCVELFPHTVATSLKYPAKDLAVVTMSFDDAMEDKDKALKFLEKHPGKTINLISTLDPVDAVDVYKIEGGAIPFFQLYDRSGKLRHTFFGSPDNGPIEPEQIDLKIKELIMEKEPAEGK